MDSWSWKWTLSQHWVSGGFRLSELPEPYNAADDGGTAILWQHGTDWLVGTILDCSWEQTHSPGGLTGKGEGDSEVASQVTMSNQEAGVWGAMVTTAMPTYPRPQFLFTFKCNTQELPFFTALGDRLLFLESLFHRSVCLTLCPPHPSKHTLLSRAVFNVPHSRAGINPQVLLALGTQDPIGKEDPSTTARRISGGPKDHSSWECNRLEKQNIYSLFRLAPTDS